MPVQFQFPSVDLSGPLTKLGSDIAGGISQRSLERDMQGALNPDGTMNFEKATAILMRHDPKAALAFATQRANADALANYHGAQVATQAANGVPDPLRILQWGQENGYLPNSEPN